jgi:hypothetical protein
MSRPGWTSVPLLDDRTAPLHPVLLAEVGTQELFAQVGLKP